MGQRTLCSLRACRKPARCRGLCDTHYGKAYRSGTLPPVQMTFAFDVHSISAIDREEQIGVCSICGPVKLRLRPGRGAECMTRRRERRGSVPRTADDRRRWKYNLTPADYQRMVEEQEGRCAVCAAIPEKLVVDHCHTTGRVRGLLCSACNVALGFLQDDVERIRNAAAYLER